MTWSPDAYLRFGSYRTRPASELLARVPLPHAELIYDLGCGPGNSTAVLRDRFAHARILAIDSSPEMIAQARRSGPPRIEWQEGRIEDFHPEPKADLLYSNAALQWIADQGALLLRLWGALRPGAVLAFQVPANFEEPSHTLILEVADRLGLGERARAAREASGVLPAHTYYGLLQTGARALDIWDTEYYQPLEGEDPVLKWTSGTALVPVMKVLSESEGKAFLSAYGAALREAYPPEADGRTILPFRRRFVVAVRA